MRRRGFRWALPAALGAAAVLLLAPAASVYYETGAGAGCTACHEIRPAHDRWRSASHRNIPCEGCHGGAWTLDMQFHLGNLRRVGNHLSGEVPASLRLREEHLPKILERCRGCHQQEFADWQSGPHAATYQAIFLDAKHNNERILMDDCLRCHGMHFAGGIGELVTPVAQRGPWKLVDPARGALPAIPCFACHSIHRPGEPLAKFSRGTRPTGAKQEVVRPSLAFFDRRAQQHVALNLLPEPRPSDPGRAVRMSPDPRQRLCFQCHAPLSSGAIGSGDDRTPTGVHEGLSCLACHQKHRQTTRASCADCHPRLSNCGLNVETMDTTFLNPASKHNVHWVKCADCHPKGVPPRRARLP